MNTDDEDVMTPEEAAIITKSIYNLNVVSKKDLEQSNQSLIQYRYLFWACMRGHIFVVDHILDHFGISPFLAEKQEGKSPFMLAIENNQEKIVKLILIKDFKYPPNQRMAD